MTVSPPTPSHLRKLPRSERNNRTLQRADALTGHGKRAINGTIIGFCGQLARVLITIASAAILSRLLTPADFGLLGMAWAVTGFVGIFSDLGLSTPTVQRPEITQTMVSTLFALNMIVGGGIMLALFIVAPVAALVFQDNRLTSVIMVLALSIPIWAAGAQHSALLARSMQWTAIQITSTASQLIALIFAILAIRYGELGLWALVFQSIVAELVSTALYWSFADWRPSRDINFRKTSAEIKFGAGITAFNFINYFHRQLDNGLIGWRWGAAPLGFYSRGYNIFQSIQTMCSGPVTGVLGPVLSRTRNNEVYYNRNVLDATAALAIMNGLVGVLSVCLSGAIIHTLLGPNWKLAGDVFTWLSPTILISGNAVLGQVFIARGDTGGLLKSSVINTASYIIGFAIALPYGVVAMAGSYSLVTLLTLPITIHLALRRDYVSQLRYYSVILPILIAAALVIFGYTKIFPIRFEGLTVRDFLMRGGLAGGAFAIVTSLLVLMIPDLRLTGERAIRWARERGAARRLLGSPPGADLRRTK